MAGILIMLVALCVSGANSDGGLNIFLIGDGRDNVCTCIFTSWGREPFCYPVPHMDIRY